MVVLEANKRRANDCDIVLLFTGHEMYFNTRLMLLSVGAVTEDVFLRLAKV